MLGLTPRRIEQLAKEMGTERPAPGMLPLRDFVTAYVAKLRESAISAQRKSDSKPRTEMKDRLLRVQVENAELDLLERTKAVTGTEDVEGAAFAEGVRVRDAFMKLGGRLCMEVAAESSAHSVRAIIDSAVREVLENLAADEVVEGEDG